MAAETEAIKRREQRFIIRTKWATERNRKVKSRKTELEADIYSMRQICETSYILG
jgi:hypothetical protein